MHVQINSPTWFFGIDALFEIATAIIAILVAITALKLYRYTKTGEFKLFSISFGMMSLGFLARAAADIIVERLIHFSPNVVKAMPALPGISRTAAVFIAGYMTHIILVLSAYLLLIILTYKITKRRLMMLLFFLTVPSLLLSGSYFLSFYGLSTILLAFIVFGHYSKCKEVKKGKLVTIAFSLLAIAQPLFVFTALNVLVKSTKEMLYVGAHTLQILGFICILIALFKIRMKR